MSNGPNLPEAGVARISLGSGLARVAQSAFIRAARGILNDGDFSDIADGLPGAEVEKLLTGETYDLAKNSLCSGPFGDFCLSGLGHARTADQLEDRLIAATQTHFYVLRDVIDNVGSHYAALQDQHLVEISLDTGEATRFWPLRHMKLTSLDDQGDFMLPGSVEDREGETHDMMAILRGMGAQPLAPQTHPDLLLRLTDGALMREEDGVLATPFAIRAAGRAQLGILRQAYPPIETEEEYRRGRAD